MKRRILLFALVTAMLLSLIPTTVGAEDYGVVEIPIQKTVNLTANDPPEQTSFELEVVEKGNDEAQFTILENNVTVTGSGMFTGTLKIAIPSEEEFWNLSEGITLREKNTGLPGWTYDETEWTIVPIQVPGSVALSAGIFNKTAGEEIDYSAPTTNHEAIELTNVYDKPAAQPNPNPDPNLNPNPNPAPEPTPIDVELRIPYTKIVKAAEGVAAPEKTFSLTFGEIPPDVLKDCEISGNRITVSAPGEYSGTLRIRPKTAATLATLIMQGFTVTEISADDAQWNCDKTEWFVAVAQTPTDGSLSYQFYNLTAGESPQGTTGGHDRLTFTNSYLKPAEEKTAVTLSFNPVGGTMYDPAEQVVPYGTEVFPQQFAGKDGYTFLGWSEAPNGPVLQNPVKATDDKTFYAVWERTPVPEDLNGTDHTAYVKGYPDNTVKPLNPITRAEVTMIFFRLLKEDVREANRSTENTFEDVKAGDWFNEAVSTMAKVGVIKGRSATVFDPNAPITRAEYAAICARFDKTETKAKPGFTDIEGHWAKELIEKAAAIGWVKGYSDRTFRPNALITRAESMTLTNRVLQRLPQSTADLLTDMKVFPDNADPAIWYYLPVQEAINGHEYKEKTDGYEAWTKLKD